MKGKGLHLGIGAKVSFQCKFIHPQRIRDEHFPDLRPGERLRGAIVVRRALKKVKHEPKLCVVVEHEDFKDENGKYYEIWCTEAHVRVDKEGDPDLFFEDYVPREEPSKSQVMNAEEITEDGSLVKGSSDDGSEEKKPDNPMATFGEVFSFAQTSRAKLNLAIGLLASVGSGLIQPAIVIVFADSFTNFSDGIDDMGVRRLAFIFLGIGVYAFAMMTIQSACLETAAAEMTDAMKRDWFDALLRQDMAYYDLLDTSGTATIISSNGKKFKRGLGRKLGDGIQFTITGLCGFAFGFWCSWKLSLILLAIVPFLGIAVGVVVKLNQTKTASANESYAKAGGVVFSSVSSIRTILSLNAVEEVIAKYESATQEAYKGATEQVVKLGVANGAVMAVFLFSYLPLTLYGSYLLYSEVSKSGCDPSGIIPTNETCRTTAFQVFGALMGITFGGSVMPQISGSVEAFVGARAACYPALVAIYRKTAREGDDEEATKKDEMKSQALQRRSTTINLPRYSIDISSPDGLRPKAIVGDIEFNDVSFRYPTRLEVDVYNGLNLSIKAGTTVAICGPSGGGKSTIIQLLERFYDPSSGSITLDGVDLRNLNVKWLRQHIGLVSQEPKLFAMSILENIKVGRPEATYEEIEDAARQANAHDFIQSFPDGYDTMVGDEGSQLSGGQKQRISIARALIMKPKIILLDEATSALDSESEVLVQQALDKLIAEEEENRTVIVVAHRLSTIKSADMIAVLSGGRVVETGKHAELISKQGAYYGLVEAQKGNKKEGSGKDAQSSRKSSILGTQASSIGFESGAHALSVGEDDLIAFQDVEFKYPARPDQKIFRGLNMTVKKGETLAIVGPSGQGKSTVIQLIEQFYRPDEGQLLYNGVPMTELNVAWLRNQMSLVAQEPVLYDMSVRDNIRFGLEDATQEEIEKAAKEANCHDFVMAFPDGYDTFVGSTATSQVSGGQKQRIAIARALLRNPQILLLDEATSALDSESERVVQAALDKITSKKNRTVVQIAHRLSTIQNSDRIIVLNDGKVRENGSHEELMALKGHYYRLVQLQSLDDDTDRRKAHAESLKSSQLSNSLLNSNKESEMVPSGRDNEDEEKNPELEKSNKKKARTLAKGDEPFFLIGAVGAIIAALMFPGWGFGFAYMIELLYFNPVFPCDESQGLLPPPPYTNSTCQEYWDSIRDDMQGLSFNISYLYVGLMFASIAGNTLVFYGFGTATERMNKRVRDASFKALLRQEVAYFDTKPVSAITSQLSDDAAMIHSFSGEPIRSLVMVVASVLVGLVVSFVYMWPFALVALGALPFMAFVSLPFPSTVIGAEAEQKMYLGEEEDTGEDENPSGVIVIESLSNIKTVAALSLETNRSEQYKEALMQEDPTPFKSNCIKGASTGIGPLFQNGSFALLYWWGGWLISNHPRLYSSRDWLISLFSILFSLSGVPAATQGATDRTKALEAASRTFDLLERESEIDPLSAEGKKDV